MAWVKLSDDFATHPKVVGLTDGAFRLWVSGIAYANQHRTRGVITDAALRGIPLAKPRTAKELEDAGLWHRNGAGWAIHDYDKFQLSPEEEDERKAAHAEQMRAWRAAKKEKRDTSRDIPRDAQRAIT
jgi:hypothetical protein